MKNAAWQTYFFSIGKGEENGVLKLKEDFWVKMQSFESIMSKKVLYTKFFFKLIFVFSALLRYD